MKPRFHHILKLTTPVIALLLFNSGFSQHSSEIYFRVQNEETSIDTVNEKIKVHFWIHAQDTLNLDSVRIELANPAISSTIGYNNESPFLWTSWSHSFYGVTMLQGDSILDSLEISFDKDRIPFYYQNLVLNLRKVSSPNNNILVSGEIFLYFTPYRTVEVWAATGFDDLIRIWNSDDNQMNNLRILADYQDLPVSDLTLEEFNNDSIERSLFSHPALSYTVPMKKVIDTFDRTDPGSEAPQPRANGCGNNRQRWTGTITGTLLARVELDTDNPPGTVDINLRNVRIKIMDKDAFPNPDDELAVGYTDADGNFSLHVNDCQRYQGSPFSAYNEGNALELYLLVEGLNSDQSIKVVRRFGGVRQGTWRQSNPWNWNYNNGNESDLNMEDVWPDTRNVQPQLLHWANLCRDFVKSTDGMGTTYDLASNARQLCVMFRPESESGAFFIPKGVPMLDWWWNDRIYLDHTLRLNEDFIFHEFGHYFMYDAQDHSWLGQAKWGDHGESYNAESPQLAWTEGWATAFGQIVDIYYRELDGEGGFDGDLGWENRSRFEIVTRTVKRPGDSNIWTENVFTHGLVSEYNIACFLVDLYDGTNRTAFWDAAPETDDGIPNGLGWGGIDNLKVPFSLIAQPLIDHPGQNQSSATVIQGIEDYVFEFTELLSCDLKSFVLPLATLNRLSNFTNPVSQNIGTDFVRLRATFEWDHYKFKGETDFAFKFKSHETGFFHQDRPVLTGTDDNFNLCVESENSEFTNFGGHISDPLVVEEGAILGFNLQEFHGFFNRGLEEHMPEPPETCTFQGYISNQVTHIDEGGQLVVGDANGTTKAIVEVCSGTTLRLGQNNMDADIASLIINNNSKLTINEGAVLEIWNNYEIVLNGDNAILEIKGTVRIMNGATFTVIEGSAGFGFVRVIKNYPPASQAFVAHNNQTSRIEFVGNGNSDKLLEIKGTDGLYIGMPGEVVINSCKIEMETGSKLNPEVSTLTMDAVNIVALNSTAGHRGVMVPGYTKTHIYYTNIEDGQWGLWFYKRGVQKAFDIRYVYLDGCYTGIVSEGIDFNYFTGAITNYYVNGIRAVGLTGLTNISNVEVTLSSQSSYITGFYQTGSGTIFIDKSTFDNNRRGIETWDGNMTLRCTKITNSSELGVIGEVTAKLKMGGGAGGYNLFDDNDNHLVSRYWGQWIIKDGHNVLKGPNSVPLFWVSMGYSVPFVDPSAKTMSGSLNLFYGGSSSPWTITSPRNLEMKGAGGLDLINHDVSSGSLGTYVSDIESTCGGPGPCNPCEMAIPYSSQRHGEVSQVITTGLFGTGDLTEQLGFLVDSANVDTPNYDFVLTGYCQILNYSYIDTPPASLQGLLKDIYADKMSIYQRAMSGYTESSNFDHANLCDNMLLCNAGLISKAKANKFPWKDMLYELYRDRASIYRFKGDYENTFVALDSGLVYVSDDAGKTDQLQYLECLFTGEKAVIDSLIPPDSIFAYFSCTPQSIAPSGPFMAQLNEFKNANSNNYKVYPNPTNGLVFVEGRDAVSISVINYLGEPVVSYNTEGIESPRWILDLENLPEGLYLIKILGKNKQVEIHKIVNY